MVSYPALTIEQIKAEHEPFLDVYVQEEAKGYLFEHAHDLSTGIGALCLDGFLQEDALQELHDTWRNVRGGTLRWAPVATGLIDLMSDLSRLYVDKNKLIDLHCTVKHLGYNPNNPAINTLVPRHHDWKDGNAVLFNWDVRGSQTYILGDREVPVQSNQLVIVDGDSTYLPSKDAYGTVVHAVETNASTAELATLERNRILLFWDGEPTDTNMLPPEA